jgi:hypothetical protein
MSNEEQGADETASFIRDDQDEAEMLVIGLDNGGFLMIHKNTKNNS